MDLKDKQTEKNKHFVASLEFALQGIRTVFKEERNMRTHLLAAIAAVIFGFVFKLSAGEWLWLILSIFLVFVVEIINTAFENVVDMVTDFHFHPIGKKIKDMAAGAVLITALFSMFVGLIIFLPKFWGLLKDFL
ncbi:diacylglycerol kinase family protein [Enterococcus sp. BWB1-3]|uniref:diacylglycerol kinase family protein n=1 Tax=unclassified Enterococcus TaxID=2608891 RepID=UPI0019243AA6|nr:MULTISPECIES: diacylglycerol kinase family protein [unclassified Enterococcus]MBL1228500.1 diacylglycerol kinase family protein [Enterococcus sp. BWB1-3]MCB5950505.1 diacylglycerol kinase family protein [Enterococcus sp. BWT-B8]MCB5954388.1 diacylglycerol kinase family protein [Enterococcus sp. CWB-B31]